MIIGQNGRFEEITENLYYLLFKNTLKEEVYKSNRICAYKMLLGINQIAENWKESQVSKIYEGLFVYTDKEEYLIEKFRHAKELMQPVMGNAKNEEMSILSNSTISIPLHSESERYGFFSELFKSYLMDINPHLLKAFKVSYKYSRVKTSEF